MESLQDLLVNELKDLYNAENQLIKALPKMAKAASNPDLQQAFTTHLEETKEHAERLEKIFETLDESPKGKKCKAMEGLIEEGKEMMEEDAEPEVLDAALISAAQKVEHYEIASYGSARTWAQDIGQDQVAELLQATLDEEAETDRKLSQLAETLVNRQAA